MPTNWHRLCKANHDENTTARWSKGIIWSRRPSSIAFYYRRHGRWMNEWILNAFSLCRLCRLTRWKSNQNDRQRINDIIKVICLFRNVQGKLMVNPETVAVGKHSWSLANPKPRGSKDTESIPTLPTQRETRKAKFSVGVLSTQNFVALFQNKQGGNVRCWYCWMPV